MGQIAMYGNNAIQSLQASFEPVATYGIDGYGITIAIVQACTLSTHNSNLVLPHVFYIARTYGYMFWKPMYGLTLDSYRIMGIWTRCVDINGQAFTFVYTQSQPSIATCLLFGTYDTCFGIGIMKKMAIK